MKMLFAFLVGAALWLVPGAASACDGCNQGHHHEHAATKQGKAPTAQLGPGEVRVAIPVAGMHCGHCVSRVESALSKLEGVKRADANLDAGEAVVVFEKSKVAPSQLVEAIDALGYKAGTPVQN